MKKPRTFSLTQAEIQTRIDKGADDSMRCYRIIRIFSQGDVPRKTVKAYVTEAEAQAHCGRPDTKQAGVYFDGYDLMVPRKRKDGRS